MQLVCRTYLAFWHRKLAIIIIIIIIIIICRHQKQCECQGDTRHQLKCLKHMMHESKQVGVQKHLNEMNVPAAEPLK